MPITGSQKALMVSRLGVQRLGAGRLDYYPPVVVFRLNVPTVARLNVMRLGASRLAYGTVVTPRLRVRELTVREYLNGQPDTVSFRADGYTPVEGNEIKIGLGALDVAHLVFAGHIVDVTQGHDAENPQNVMWDVVGKSYEWRLQEKTVSKTYVNQSATAIVQDLVALSGTGFATTYIAAGLPTIEEISFRDVDVASAIDEVMRRIGGYWKVDYGRNVHAFLSENLTSQPVTDSDTRGAFVLRARTDLAPIRTRIVVRGGGSRASVAIAVGETTVPLEDASKFGASGGTAFADTQEFTYTGKVDGNTGSNVAGMDGPAGAAVAAIASGVGGVLGDVRYKVGFKNAAGETVPGAASNLVTGIVVATPGSIGLASAVSGIGRVVGAVKYKATFKTSQGETDLATTEVSITAVAVAAPSAPSVALLSGLGPLVGALGYKVTFVTQYGETVASSAGSRTAAAVSAPGACVVNAVSTTIGVLIGAFSYKVTFVNALGETTGGTTASRTATAQSAPSAPTVGTHVVGGPLIGGYKYKVSFVSATGETIGTATGTTTAATATATAPTVGGSGTGATIAYANTYVHPVYGESALSSRTIDTDKAASPTVDVNDLPSGCGWNIFSTGTVAAGTGGTAPLFKIKEKGVDDDSTFTHTTETGPGEGVRPTLGKMIPLTSIATGPTGTIARRVYRTKAGGSSYFLVGEIPDNSTTTFTDDVPDTALTVSAPIQNLNGQQHALTSIPTGPTGTLARRLYRTVAGGSEYKLLAEISDNSTTAFTDNVADANLGAATIPLTSTAGGEQHTVTIPTGPTGTLARRLYRTEAGGSIYRFLAEIADNVATTFADDKADQELGAATEPLQNTAGGQNVSLSGVPTGGTGVIARLIYRTKAGGSEYFLVGKIPDNVTSTFVDDKKDDEITVPAPTENDAGSSIVSLSSVPLGPAGITTRRVYRTKGGGSDYFLVGQINDNVTTVFTDDASDERLHEAAPTASTLGALAGDTSLRVDSSTPFPAAGGWVRVDSHVLRYASAAASTLSGIPTSGVGAIVASLKVGAAVLVEPHLVGIPASGAGALSAALAQGDDVRVLVRANDAAAQASLAAAIGAGDGVREDVVDDSALSLAEATALGAAKLTLLKDPLASVTYRTPDQSTRCGREVTFALGAPTSLAGTFMIQSVTISEFDPNGRAFPIRAVDVGSQRYSLEALLRLVRAA